MAGAGEVPRRSEELPAGFLLREATMADLPAVEAMAAATYNGHDYLARVFPGWLEQPSVNFVWGIEDKATKTLVAIENLAIKDDGETGWFEALRVLPPYRGRGFARLLQSHLVDKVAPAIERLLRLRYATKQDNVASLRLASASGLEASSRRCFLFQPLCWDPERPLLDRLAAAAGPDPPVATRLTAAEWTAAAAGHPTSPVNTTVFHNWKVWQTRRAGSTEPHPALQRDLTDSGLLLTRCGDSLAIGSLRRSDDGSAAWVLSVWAASLPSLAAHMWSQLAAVLRVSGHPGAPAGAPAFDGPGFDDAFAAAARGAAAAISNAMLFFDPELAGPAAEVQLVSPVMCNGGPAWEGDARFAVVVERSVQPSKR